MLKLFWYCDSYNIQLASKSVKAILLGNINISYSLFSNVKFDFDEDDFDIYWFKAKSRIFSEAWQIKKRWYSDLTTIMMLKEVVKQKVRLRVTGY